VIAHNARFAAFGVDCVGELFCAAAVFWAGLFHLRIVLIS